MHEAAIIIKQLLFNDNHSPARTFFFIRCPMNKKIILVWPYYVNYDIGNHEIWQPFMKLYKCIYPSTSSPLENVQVKMHISTTVVISVINFQLFGLSGASFLPIPVLVCSLLRAHFWLQRWIFLPSYRKVRFYLANPSSLIQEDYQSSITTFVTGAKKKENWVIWSWIMASYPYKMKRKCLWMWKSGCIDKFSCKNWHLESLQNRIGL